MLQFFIIILFIFLLLLFCCRDKLIMFVQAVVFLNVGRCPMAVPGCPVVFGGPGRNVRWGRNSVGRIPIVIRSGGHSQGI